MNWEKFIVVYLLLFACSSPKKISNQNVSFIYEYNPINPQYLIWHFSDDSTRLYLKVNPQDLKQTDSSQTASFKIQYSLFSDFDSKILLHGDSMLNKISSKQLSKNIFFLNFKTELSKKYLLEIVFIDLNSNKRARNFISVDRSSINNRQNFIAINISDGSPIFENYFSDTQKYFVCHYRDSFDIFHAKYFESQFEPAPPTFFDLKKKSVEFTSDSSFFISAKSTLYFSKRGIYHFQIDTTVNEGLTLLCFHDDFPNVTIPEILVETLRYLAKNEEYKQMSEAEDKKSEADNFWLQRAGDKDRAKVLIKEYYSRIQFANEHFTSYKEGWQTDRGLVYVIYGKPDMVYKNSKTENWIYNKTVTEAAISFNFVKMENIFSENHFYLQRDLVYEDSWNIATHKWRHGRINEIIK